MKFEWFSRLYCEARYDYSDEEMFIAERGWQDWMEDFPEEKLGEILSTIWDFSKCSINELREKLGINKKKFAAIYNIPYATMVKWDVDGDNNRNPPEYLEMLVAYTVYENMTLEH